MDISKDNKSPLDLTARKKRAGKIFLRWVLIAWAIVYLIFTYYKEIIAALGSL
jgi:hypothetical protein